MARLADVHPTDPPPPALQDVLPVDLLRIVLQCLNESGLRHIATCCHALEVLSDDVARLRCTQCGTQRKGLWCHGMSWRVQLSAKTNGRVFRPSATRVLRQYGSAGTRRGASSLRTFNKPVAVAVLPGGQAAVCNFGSRSVSVVRVVDGQVIETFSVDGAPSGITHLRSRAAANRVVVAISVQGTAESGDAIPGVVDPSHRIEAYSIADSLAGGLSVRLWVCDSACLSYPNGLVADELGTLFISSWNDHRVRAISAHAESTTEFGNTEAPHTALDRPADVVLLPHPRIGPVLAVADYYGKAIQLYVRPDGMSYSPCGNVGVKRRSRASPCLDRPSSLAVEAYGVDWARVLVAETGGMCISVFHVHKDTSRQRSDIHYDSSHLYDICVEQIGSGLHAPQRGLWGWLGVACAPNGDVVVSDCDNECLLVI